ncbi:MAG: glutamine-synthetase adenylyltransferase, partial [Bryobacteraceae bacterium]
VLQLGSLSDVAEELSNLSDAILDYTYRALYRVFTLRHGTPHYLDEDGTERNCGFAVIALGKLGGKELNYSSDIDLMFLYSAPGHTAGPEAITNKEFFKKVANQLTDLLSTYTPEGFCYRVDLRLRPDGRHGEICMSLKGARYYYEARGRDWELQMLIKARVAAGDREVGRALLDGVEPMIYSTTLDFRSIESVSETRERISEKLAGRPRRAPSNHPCAEGLDIKLSAGGIRDIEFLVQCLQRLHGGREPWVRHGGTLFALFRLRDKGLLSDKEYSGLASAYQFLRQLEHRLQFLDDRQTHTLPAHLEDLEVLARKMPPETSGMPVGATWLLNLLDTHLAAVRELYERVIYAQRPMYYSPIPPAAVESVQEPAQLTLAPSSLIRFLEQRAPQFAAVLARAKLHRGRNRFEYFLERLLANPETLELLDSNTELAQCAIDLFEHSQHFSDQLIRDPGQIIHLCPAGPEVGGGPLDDVGELRRYFAGQMLRLQSESLFRRIPIFTTLDQLSDLADTVVAAAYRIALGQALSANPPASASYTPHDQMVVISLGRLGMREYDLASDADLSFVIPDRDVSEQLFWTGVAERMIAVISAYTGDGVMFTVDPRLRPNGREGALVQTESAYKEYFSKNAEAWEGISYMKARGVAGNIERATHFLHELQEVDWRRYGQGGRSRQELAQMRGRLEREQGSRNPLKAGRGGYYDIDFALMYLRLKGAGIFYRVLNTPARIDVVEQMGHIERDDAAFLRDAATFYRAIDHGLRIMSGHAEGKLPTAQSQVEILTGLVHRWTPERLHDQPLHQKLSLIRNRTRQFFEQIFG